MSLSKIPGFNGIRPTLKVALAMMVVCSAVAFAHAQVAYTGTTAAQNFGSVGIGAASSESLTFSISAGTTVGSVAVLTGGSTDLDFTQAAGTTCTAADYAAATNC